MCRGTVKDRKTDKNVDGYKSQKTSTKYTSTTDLT